MQPTYDESSNSDTGSWGSSPGYAPASQVDSVSKARPWLTALSAFVTLLVLIAAAGNQGVVDAVARHSNGTTLGDHLAHLVNVYAWRFSPVGDHDFARTWVAGLSAVGATLVLTLLLVAVVARGFGGFWQTFFSVWSVVVAATLLGAYVRASVTDVNQLGGLHQSTAENILFSVASPNSSTVLAGFLVGFLVALVAAVVAVSTRRSEVVAAPPLTFGLPWARSEDDEPRPWQSTSTPGPTVPPAPWSSSDTGRTGASAASGSEHTAQLPAVEQQGSDDESTIEHAPSSSPPPPPASTVAPPPASPPSTPPASTPASTEDEGQATTQFPRHAPPPEEQR